MINIPFKTLTPVAGAMQMQGYQLLEVKQGSPEWLQGRAGLTTASLFSDCVATLKTGKNAGQPSEKNKQIAAETSLELITGLPWGDTFQTYAMRRGSEQEMYAREAYMRKFDLDVTETGIAITLDRQFGYSTDGEVEGLQNGKRGGIEIKTPLNGGKLLDMLISGDVAEYEHQMQGGMWICGWDFIDYIMWIPEKHKADGDGLYVKRIHRNDKFIETMETQLLEHRGRVEQALKVFTTKFDLLAERGMDAVKFDDVIDVEARTVQPAKAIETTAAPAPASAAAAPAIALDPSVSALFS